MLLEQILGKNIKLFTFLHNKFMILNIFRIMKFLTFINKKGDLAQLSPMVAGEIFFKCYILKEKVKNAFNFYGPLHFKFSKFPPYSVFPAYEFSKRGHRCEIGGVILKFNCFQKRKCLPKSSRRADSEYVIFFKFCRQKMTNPSISADF